jgi:hypothetical protein
MLIMMVVFTCMKAKINLKELSIRRSMAEQGKTHSQK